MQLRDFSIGGEFMCGERRWRCTDTGSRTVVAICLDAHDDPSWFEGPTYAVPEVVFDEFDIKGCTELKMGWQREKSKS